MRLAAIVSCRHPLGTDSARALADDQELLVALRGSVDAVVLEHTCTHGGHWNLNAISYAAYRAGDPALAEDPARAEAAAPLGAAVRGLPAGVLNPVWLAEQLATLDHAWGGRFAAGLVLAGPDEFVAHGMDPSLAIPRFEESLAILGKMWSGEPFSADGQAYRFDEVRPTLLPYTAGGPPLSLSVTDADGAAFAAQRRLGVHLPASAAGSADALISSYRRAGGAGEVAVEVLAGEQVGSTVAALDQLGVAQVDLRLPATQPGDPDPAKALEELLAAAGWALGR